MEIGTWKRKRIATTIVFLFQVFISAIEISINYTTSWLYLKKITNNSKYLGLYYGLSLTALLLPGILFINIIAYYADKYRRVKVLIILGNSLTLIGCILYLIPISPVYFLLGRFFIGFNVTTGPLVVGEFARSYDRKDLHQIVLLQRGIFVFGKAAGPVLVVLFLHSNFYIGTLHVEYENISAVIIFGLVVLAQILVYFFASDLSREFDLMEQEFKNNCSDDRVEEEGLLINEDEEKKVNIDNVINEQHKDELNDSDEKHTIKKVERKSAQQLIESILKDKDILFLLISSFLHSVISQMIFLAIPVIVLEKLLYFKSTVNVVMTVQLLGFVLMLIVLYFIKLKRVTNGILGWILKVLSLTTTLVISKYFSYTVNLILLICVLIFLEVSILKLRVFFVTTLASFVDSKYQSFTDSIREQTTIVGNIVGSLIAASSAKYVNEYFGAFAVLTIIILIVTVIKRNILGDNKIRI